MEEVGMKTWWALGLGSLAVLVVLAIGCSKKAEPPSDIEYFPADSKDRVVGAEMVTVDPAVSADGKGSLKITVEQPTTVQLYEVPSPKAENSDIFYKAKLKAKDFGGDAYLQMIIHYPSGGEVTAHNYEKAIGGTTDWTAMETKANIRKGQKPDVVRLNLILNGGGTVWVDDVHLFKVPRPE
jgi:hypothetical protein